MEFNFYNRLRLSIDSHGHRGYERYFRNEYRRISPGHGNDAEVPTISVKIVKRLPDDRTGDIRRVVSCKRLFTFEYLVRDLNSENVEIYFKRHFLDKLYMNAIAVFLQAQVLEPVMYLKLLQRDNLLLHAGGVCDDEYGYVFPAHGGTGKTTFSIALLSQGYQLLGDDLLFIDVSDSTIYPYPRPLHLFTYNIDNLYGARVPLHYRMAIYCKNVIRFFLERALRTEFLISTRVHADEIFHGNPFGKAVPAARICFLVKEGEPVSMEEINESTVASQSEEIMKSADLNDSLYDVLRDDSEVEKVKRLERDVIQRFLLKFQFMNKVNTRKLDLTDLRSFARENLRIAQRTAPETRQ